MPSEKIDKTALVGGLLQLLLLFLDCEFLDTPPEEAVHLIVRWP
jgi:hypothetical protein